MGYINYKCMKMMEKTYDEITPRVFFDYQPGLHFSIKLIDLERYIKLMNRNYKENSLC